MYAVIGMSLMIGFSSAAIAQTAPAPATTQQSNATMAQPPAAAPLLSDEQIAQVLLTINHGEIEAGQMATRSAKHKDVRGFAGNMVEEHKKNVAETKNLLRKMKMKAADSDLSKSLTEEAKTAKKDLKTTQANYDQTYIQQQITMHEKALSTLDSTLIPGAKNTELRSHLEKTRAAVQAHLEHAKTLQTSTLQ